MRIALTRTTLAPVPSLSVSLMPSLPEVLVAFLHPERYDDRRVLVVDAPDAEVNARFAEETEAVEVTHWCTRADYAALHAGAHFGHAPPSGPFDVALVFLPKSKGRLEYILDAVVSVLNAGADVLLVGHKKQGIASAPRRLRDHVGDTVKLESARHCMLHQATAGEPRPFSPEERMQRVRVETPFGPLELCALPGVFAAGRLDEGTSMLLPHLKYLKDRRRVLDWGCGCGVIAACAARVGAEEVVAADVDALAVASARATAMANGVQVEVVASDVYAALTGRFSDIVANPPFHDGVRTSMRASSAFVREAPARLTRAGRLLFVANRFVKHPESLNATFRRWEVVEEDGRFRVVRASAKEAL